MICVPTSRTRRSAEVRTESTGAAGMPRDSVAGHLIHVGFQHTQGSAGSVAEAQL